MSRDEAALRALLHATAERVEPASDGLDRIRARLTEPKPPLLAWAAIAGTRLSLRAETIREAAGWITRQAWPAGARLLARAGQRYREWVPPRVTRGLRSAGVHAQPRVASLIAAGNRWLGGRPGGRLRWLRPAAAMTAAVLVIGAVVYIAATGVSQVISPAGSVTGANHPGGQHASHPATGHSGSTQPKPAASDSPTCAPQAAPKTSPASSPAASSSPTSVPGPSSSPTAAPSSSPSPSPTSSPSPSVSPSPSPSGPASASGAGRSGGAGRSRGAGKAEASFAVRLVAPPDTDDSPCPSPSASSTASATTSSAWRAVAHPAARLLVRLAVPLATRLGCR